MAQSVVQCLGMFPSGLLQCGALRFLGNCFLSQVREVSSSHLFKYFLRPFLSPRRDPCEVLVHLLSPTS